jgi:hypothetical protein
MSFRRVVREIITFTRSDGLVHRSVIRLVKTTTPKSRERIKERDIVCFLSDL